MDCDGTTYVGRGEDDLGLVRHVFCHACRTNDIEAWDRHRNSWRITYLDPKTVRADPDLRRKRRLLDPIRRAFA